MTGCSYALLVSVSEFLRLIMLKEGLQSYLVTQMRLYGYDTYRTINFTTSPANSMKCLTADFIVMFALPSLHD